MVVAIAVATVVIVVILKARIVTRSCLAFEGLYIVLTSIRVLYKVSLHVFPFVAGAVNMHGHPCTHYVVARSNKYPGLKDLSIVPILWEVKGMFASRNRSSTMCSY